MKITHELSDEDKKSIAKQAIQMLADHETIKQVFDQAQKYADKHINAFHDGKVENIVEGELYSAASKLIEKYIRTAKSDELAKALFARFTDAEKRDLSDSIANKVLAALSEYD